ncbi:hypothetical protein SLOPH_898 [Spraguea lophii 42_110]|uniref:EamA domain-containing protein n=1 Tax=Spraguea lophii (strain 42_110) TaxID=1358809 RepID=S7XJ72_SPRLO|nr:hypothetical protein SLOPH_898 [Spraguea lophii 42_110]
MKYKDLFFRCLFGQCIGLCFGCYGFCANNLPKNTWLFLTIGIFFITLFTLNELFFKGKGNPPHKEIFICSFSIIGVVLFMLYAYRLTQSYYVAFISQLIYPINVIYKVYIRKEKENITITKLFLFLMLVIITFFINKNNDIFTFSILATIFALLGNIAIIVNLYLVQNIIKKCNVKLHLRYLSLYSFIIGLILTSILDRKHFLPMNEILPFYKNNIFYILGYSLFLSSAYLMNPRYVKKYKPICFQTSMLSSSSYLGIAKMIGPNFSYVKLGLYLVCITSSIILTIYSDAEEEI